MLSTGLWKWRAILRARTVEGTYLPDSMELMVLRQTHGVRRKNISRYPRYPPPPRRLPPRGAGIARSRRSQNKKRSLAKWLNSVSAVRTRLELATPGVTGRYSKPTELPHQLSVNFPFGIAKVQLKFDSANILKEINEKMSGRRVGHSSERGREVTGPRSACGPFRVRSS